MTGIESLILPVGTTLERFILKNQTQFSFASGELSQLLRDIALASKIVNRDINHAGLINLGGSMGLENVQGEQQQKLDLIADVRFTRALTNGGEVCAILSEEKEEPVLTGNNNAKYIVAIDPLDGSSNIDVDVSVGTIFSIFKRKSALGTIPNLDDFLPKGRDQVAAGYVLYGSSTILVYTTGQGVNGFTYEPSLGEFYLSHPNLKFPSKESFYSINEGYYYDYPEKTRKFIEHCKNKRMSARYIGSLVADFHRNLFKGGIYIYPPTKTLPNGKLRLLYECFPMAFLTEQAGGCASNGEMDVMELKSEQFHQRSTLLMGNAVLVNLYNSF
jgi:fructose-1,6-bisphosphatase I